MLLKKFVQIKLSLPYLFLIIPIHSLFADAVVATVVGEKRP